MPILSAENSFKKGLAALVDNHFAEATDHFRRAMETERQRRPDRPSMRYLSYYGFCLARSSGNLPAAIEACRTASRKAPRNPDLLFNLARVYLLAGKARPARDALDRGLSISPENLALQRERARVEKMINAGRRPSGRWTARLRTVFRPSAAAF